MTKKEQNGRKRAQEDDERDDLSGVSPVSKSMRQTNNQLTQTPLPASQFTFRIQISPSDFTVSRQCCFTEQRVDRTLRPTQAFSLASYVCFTAKSKTSFVIRQDCCLPIHKLGPLFGHVVPHLVPDQVQGLLLLPFLQIVGY